MALLEKEVAVTQSSAGRAASLGRGRASRITDLARRVWDFWLDMPLMMHLGLLVVGFGTLFDIWAHWSAGDLSPTLTRFTFPERLGHWIVLVGMLISITGVIMRGYRRPAQRPGGHNSRR